MSAVWTLVLLGLGYLAGLGIGTVWAEQRSMEGRQVLAQTSPPVSAEPAAPPSLTIQAAEGREAERALALPSTLTLQDNLGFAVPLPAANPQPALFVPSVEPHGQARGTFLDARPSLWLGIARPDSRGAGSRGRRPRDGAESRARAPGRGRGPSRGVEPVLAAGSVPAAEPVPPAEPVPTAAPASVVEPVPAAEPVPAPRSSLEEYQVGIDDILDINVLQPEALAATVTVGPDGLISFPFIGSVSVKGLTISHIQETIQQRLADGYMKYPVVAASLKESRSRKFFVYGEVARPGSYPVQEDATVIKAISMAGGFTKYGSSSRVKVLRPRADRPGYETLKMNIKAAMDGRADEDLPVQPGDTIVVSEGMF